MSRPSQRSGGGGIGITGVLFVVFLVLKLCGVVFWPWIWIFSPLFLAMVFE